MTIAENSRAVPLQLRLHQAKKHDTRGFDSVMLAGAALLRGSGWYAKAYGSIMGVLLLALGSLVVLQCHWLFRRITHMPLREKEVLKNVG